MPNENRDRALLYPPFAERLAKFEGKLLDLALPFELFEAYRTPERQLMLYAQGRATPGRIVTRSRPENSLHCYGLAADYVARDAAGKWTWAERHDWRAMGMAAWKAGLESGYFFKSFPDPPHIQCRFGLEPPELVALWLAGGIERVWKQLDLKLRR